MANSAEFSAGSIHNATVLHFLSLQSQPIGTTDFSRLMDIPQGFDMGSKLYSLVPTKQIEITKAGSKNLYSITEAGLKYLKNNELNIQKIKDITYLKKGERGVRTAHTARQPEPIMSKAANDVINQIAPIIDRNQTLYTVMGDLLLALNKLGLPEEKQPLPAKEVGLMETISLIQIDSAKIENQLIKIKTILDEIRNHTDESSKTGDTK